MTLQPHHGYSPHKKASTETWLGIIPNYLKFIAELYTEHTVKAYTYTFLCTYNTCHLYIYDIIIVNTHIYTHKNIFQVVYKTSTNTSKKLNYLNSHHARWKCTQTIWVPPQYYKLLDKKNPQKCSLPYISYTLVMYSYQQGGQILLMYRSM